ncbi:MAG: OmpA family protein, partial [Candidatus Aureabacteria bacterium]|nr:OmpA family protein [Candidatus Auribacterota bacterium]
SLQSSLGLLANNKAAALINKLPTPVAALFHSKQGKPFTEPKNPNQKYLENLAKKIKSIAVEMEITNLLTASVNGNKMAVNLPESLLFKSGNSLLKKDKKTTILLDKLVELFQKVPFPMSIEGHTDNELIATTRYQSNWELSSDRALSVLHYFVEAGISPKRIQAVAHGEFKPRTTNETLHGKKMNRRVEIQVDVTQPTEEGVKNG